MEGNMNSFRRFGFAALTFVLINIAALPVYSQSRSFMFQTDSSGAYLGIRMDDVTASNMSKYKLTSEKGVIVREVEKQSPAENAKLQPEDVILDYGGFPVWSSAQMARMVQETPVGRKVELAVSRDGKRMTLTAQIASREDRQSENRMDLMPNDRFGQMFRDFRFNFPDSQNRGVVVTPSRKPRLGVTLQPLNNQIAESLGVAGKKGALVYEVQEGSPSAGKLKPLDVVIQADGKEISDPEDLIQAVNNKSEGSMNLKVIRDKKEIAVVVTLPANPTEGKKGNGIKL